MLGAIQKGGERFRTPQSIRSVDRLVWVLFGRLCLGPYEVTYTRQFSRRRRLWGAIQGAGEASVHPRVYEAWTIWYGRHLEDYAQGHTNPLIPDSLVEGDACGGQYKGGGGGEVPYTPEYTKRGPSGMGGICKPGMCPYQAYKPWLIDVFICFRNLS